MPCGVEVGDLRVAARQVAAGGTLAELSASDAAEPPCIVRTAIPMKQTIRLTNRANSSMTYEIRFFIEQMD